MKTKSALSALAGLALLGSVTHADELVYAFTAELDTNSLGDPVLAGSIAEGLLDNSVNTLTGTFAYDPDAPQDTGGFSLFQTRYQTGRLTIDQVVAAPSSVFQLDVRNDIGSNDIDGLGFGQGYATGDIIDFVLTDSTGTVYTEPVIPPSIDFSDFDDSTIRFSYFEGEGESSVFREPAVYTITALTLVPEPTSLALLGLGGLVVTLRRRSPASPTDNRTTLA
ncbi:MAG: PEP-CTERM sorting domain-containing protein [Planctomycetota bacterium]